MSSENKYLNYDGLTTLWSKIKSYISSLGYTTNKGTVGGSGTSGYLAKWTGTTAVGNGPQLGNSTVTFLRNDGNWVAPVGTTYATATTAANGLLSSSDKIKLNKLEDTYVPITTIGGISTVTIDTSNNAVNLSTSSTWSSGYQHISIQDGEYPSVQLASINNFNNIQSRIAITSFGSSDKISIQTFDYNNQKGAYFDLDTENVWISTNATSGVHITQVADPTNVQDAANKRYVDSAYIAGTGLTASGTTFNHSNSIAAGTVGSTSVTASTGSTVEIPYVTYDAQGHITSTGTHKHIVPVSEGGDSNVSATVVSGVLILTVESEYEDGTEVGY